MQIRNDTDTFNSLYHDCLFKCGLSATDTNIYKFEDFVREANNSCSKIESWIWRNTGEWEYDDSNYTDFPIATRDLQDGVQDYSLPIDVERVDRCEITLIDGSKRKLTLFDKGQIDISLDEFAGEKGEPLFYDLLGNSLFLYPAPDLTKVQKDEGLELYFSRGIDKFLVTDTTKEPGFAKTFHQLVSLDAAIAWCNIHDQNKIPILSSERDTIKEELENFYGKRSRENRTQIKRKYNNNKRK